MNYDMRHEGGKSVVPFLVGMAATMLVGGYVLFGPEGRRNRRGVHRFLKRAKYEILDKMEQAGDVTEDQYYKIVEDVSTRYDSMKNSGSEKVGSMASYFRERWDEMHDAARRARDEARNELEAEEYAVRNGKSSSGGSGSSSGGSTQTYPLSERPTNPQSSGGPNTPEGTN